MCKRKKLSETQIQHFFFLSEKLQNWGFLSAEGKGTMGGMKIEKGSNFGKFSKKAEIRLKAEDSHPWILKVKRKRYSKYFYCSTCGMVMKNTIDNADKAKTNALKIF